MILNILYQFNEKYAPFAGVSMTSLFINNVHFEKITVYILGENLSAKTQEKLIQTAKNYDRTILFIDAKEVFVKMKELNMPCYRGSYAANLRLFLSEVLDEEVNRILYLDADTIITQQLDGLAGLDMKHYAVAMSLDSLGKYHKLEIGFLNSDYYFNSGVILFEMDNWRTYQLTEKIIDHVSRIRANYPAPDQDLLNVVCREKIKLLPAQYNLQPIHVAFPSILYFSVFKPNGYYTEKEIKEALRKPVIYHFFRFMGEFPWNKESIHPDVSLFDKYLSLSEWKDLRREKAVFGTYIRIERMLYRILPNRVFMYIFYLGHTLFMNRANKDSLKNRINKNM